MRMRPRPSHMSTPSGGCLGWSIILALCAISWPLAIVGFIIFGLWTDSDQYTRASIIKFIATTIIAIIAVASPIFSIATIASPEKMPISEYWPFWIFTTAEPIAVIYLGLKRKRGKDEEQDLYYACAKCGNLQWGYDKSKRCLYCGHDIISTGITCDYYIKLSENERENLRVRLRNLYVYNSDEFDEMKFKRRKVSSDVLE